MVSTLFFSPSLLVGSGFRNALSSDAGTENERRMIEAGSKDERRSIEGVSKNHRRTIEGRTKHCFLFTMQRYDGERRRSGLKWHYQDLHGIIRTYCDLSIGSQGSPSSEMMTSTSFGVKRRRFPISFRIVRSLGFRSIHSFLKVCQALLGHMSGMNKLASSLRP